MAAPSANNGVYPLIWSDTPGQIADWAATSLGLTESWRAPDGNAPEHVELNWGDGRISINIRTAVNGAGTGPTGVAVRVADRSAVDTMLTRARQAGAQITQGPEDSRVAYSFTAVDADGNQWWVHAESGFLDQLRGT